LNLLRGKGIRPYGLQTMNKSQLIDALAARLGDRRTAASAVDGLLSTIVETVKSGESVSLTGFGVFEARDRAARVGRNPRTGQTVAVPAATVPAFRPGMGFKAAVGGTPSTPPPRAARPRAATVPGEAVEAPAKPAKKAAAAKKSKKEPKKKAKK
jgi:DNA-binding protein HU-beta